MWYKLEHKKSDLLDILGSLLILCTFHKARIVPPSPQGSGELLMICDR